MKTSLKFSVLLVSLFVGFFPPLYLIPVGISFFLLGFDMFDTSLALQGIPFKQRLKLHRAHMTELIALGAIVSSSVIAPPVFLFAIPAGYLTATLRLRKWGLG